ncbi:MAG TPA: alpha/beta fold hydrolase [Burkholderiales bacterium]|nr:alpha/beta fold hydrolase [Burkholderiales bacterium]
MTSEVVLVPGLWVPTAIMTLLAARLGRSGYATRRFGYRGRAPLEANIERLARFIDGRSVHLVGHSLGGVLIYDMLVRHPEIASGNVVLLGAPVRGCYAGRRFGSHSFGRWLLGACAARWESNEARWQRPERLGVIAGTLPLGFGRAFGQLPGDNDGVVCVHETTVDGMSERALVRTGHSLLTVSARVGTLVEHFLRTGRFA